MMIIDIMGKTEPLWFSSVHTPDGWQLATERRDNFIREHSGQDIFKALIEAVEQTGNPDADPDAED